MRRNKIFTGLVILVLLLVALAWALSKHPRLKYLLATPTDYAQCVEAGGAILESYPTQCLYRGQTFANPDQQAAEQTASELKTYEDTNFGFSLKYPADIFTESKSQLPFPFSQQQGDLRQVTTLTHEIPVEHCDLSGRPEGCTRTTKDITISLMPLNTSRTDVLNNARTYLEVDLPELNLGQVTAKTALVGAEGEGRFYYVVDLHNDKTLIIIRSYINEQVVTSYKTQADFIPFNEQEELFKRITSSLQLTESSTAETQTGPSLAQLAEDTSSWETFTNNTRGYAIKHPTNWIIEPINLANVRYLKFTSPDRKYLLTVGIKNTSESIALSDRTGTGAGDIVNRGQLAVAGSTLPINALTANGDISNIFYYPFSNAAPGRVVIRSYEILAEFNRLSGTTSLDQSAELKIANAILASLVLTK